jgi:D-alanine-D-alanine ligase-like ATP-grasp enzyme
MNKLRVGVILGGMSSEREVSLNSGRNVHDNLDREAYAPVPVFMDGEGRLWVIPWQLISQNTTTDVTERLEKETRRISYEGLKAEIDFAFLSLHGKFGEDGCMQGLLELLGIPYTGPGVLASALGMDKHIQQRILQAAGVGVPESLLVRETEWRNDPEGVIRALEVTEITPQSDYFTYDDQYMPGRCRKFTPPRNIPPHAVEAIMQEAVRAFRALGFRSYGRIDGFHLKDGRILITDPNSSSGMAPSSFFFEQAACAGMLPSMILGRLIENAIVIHRGKHGPL